MLNFWWSSEPDPSAEVSEILDGNKPPAENKKEEEEESLMKKVKLKWNVLKMLMEKKSVFLRKKLKK